MVKALFTLQGPKTAQNTKTEQAEQTLKKILGLDIGSDLMLKLFRSDQRVQRYKQLRFSSNP